MTREELDQLVEKLRELTRLLDSSRDDDYEQFTEKYSDLVEIINSDNYEDDEQIDRFIVFLEDNSSEFIDGNEGDYGYEKDAWDHFIEVEEESKNWDSLYPNGGNDE
jgi:hypothetical protein